MNYRATCIIYSTTVFLYGKELAFLGHAHDQNGPTHDWKTAQELANILNVTPVAVPPREWTADEILRREA